MQTEQTAAATFAADGVTPVHNIPGYPLMVRAADFNAALATTPAVAEGAVAREDFDRMSADLTRAKNLLVRLYEQVKHNPNRIRPMIEEATGTWFVWGQDRDTPPAQAADSTEPVAWRYVPSKVWKDFVFTEKQENADYARSIGVQVEPLYTRPIAAEAVPPASCAPEDGECATCVGTGTVSDQGIGLLETFTHCPDCKGSGRASNAAEPAGCSVNPVLSCVCDRGTKSCNVEHAPAVPAGLSDAKDAERYRWLRDPDRDVSLVLDKVVGYTPIDSLGGGGYNNYEYRAGDELDAAIDAALAASAPAAELGKDQQ